MLTTVEAEIETDGIVRLLEPVKISRKSRAIVTILDGENGDRKQMSEEEERLAEEGFARWVGSVKSGNPRSADNEQIDKDLAREYGCLCLDQFASWIYHHKFACRSGEIGIRTRLKI